MKKYKIKNIFGDIEPHEVFLDKMAAAKEEELGVSQKKLEVALSERISYFLFSIFLLAAAALFSKTFYLQVVQGKNLSIAAENNKSSANIIVPPRGIIYDKNQKKLVSNSSIFDLVCSKNISAGVAGEIASAISANLEDLQRKIEQADTPEFLMAEDLSHENLVVLEAKISGLQGCRIQQNTARNYLYGAVFSQILGYTGRINKQEYAGSAGYSLNDYIGKTGVEKHYETYLRGKVGELKTVKTALGSNMAAEITVQPEAGQNLVLNIDAELQKRIYESLGQRLKDIGAKKGAAVAMDPRSGAVLALVSYPSYDNNLFSGGISQAEYETLSGDPSQPLFNRAIAAHYPTGSTIKPFEAAAALQEKLISPDKKINDPGYIEVRSVYDPSVVYRFRGVKPHGWVNMKEAIAVSSNIYFYTVGGGYGDQKGLGPTKIKEYLSLFGWDQKTGIDLPGEYSGFIPDPEWKKRTKNESWWNGDTYNLSIGQSDLQTTPLQVASAYCAIANGGTLYKPQIVNKITDEAGSVIRQFSPQVARDNFIDPQNLEIVREGMRDGVTESYGLSKSLKSLPVVAAAKTGTAEIGYYDRFNVWSAVFAPYENPEIVLVVTAEEVQGLGAVTLPVSKDVLNWYFGK